MCGDLWDTPQIAPTGLFFVLKQMVWKTQAFERPQPLVDISRKMDDGKVIARSWANSLFGRTACAWSKMKCKRCGDSYLPMLPAVIIVADSANIF